MGKSTPEVCESKDASPEVDEATTRVPVESEDLSLLGAHGQSETTASASVTSSESREPLPGDAKRKEDRKKIIRELAIVMETALAMEAKLRREENIKEGEEHLTAGEENGVAEAEQEEEPE